MENKLRTTLKVNAFFSGASGLGMLFFANVLAPKFNLTNSLSLYIIGGGLLLFGITVLLQAVKVTLSKKQIVSIIIQDFLWVIGCVIMLVFQPFNLSNTAYWFVAASLFPVLLFGVFQAKYLKQL